MKECHEEIVNILKSVISNQQYLPQRTDNKYWEEAYNASQEHFLSEVIFHKIANAKVLPNEIYEKWKRQSIICRVASVRHLSQIEDIVQLFTKSGIECILLKGLVMKDFYPLPELRAMSDADILVKESDLDKATEILIDNGFYQNGITTHHRVMEKKGYKHIELHWTITNSRIIESGEMIDKSIWDEKREILLGKEKTYSLSLEDQVIHLALHMGAHFSSIGFGLKQLFDLAILIDRKNNDIDWNIVEEKIKATGKNNFIRVIFLLCNYLFEVKVPIKLKELSLDENEKMKVMVEIICNGGVYGKCDKANVYINKFAYKTIKYRTEVNKDTKLNRIIYEFFPSRENLSIRYKYAKDNSVLLPIAWIHRCIRGGIRYSNELKQYSKGIYSDIKTVSKKDQIYSWLEL